MNRRTFVASLAAVPVALGAGATALAQTPAALEGALPGVGQLKGVQGAVARIWYRVGSAWARSPNRAFSTARSTAWVRTTSWAGA